MIPQSQPRRQRNSSKVNLLISFAFHAVLVIVLLYFAARSGMLGMHVGKPLWVKLIAPKPGAEKKPGAEQPDDDATSLFANGDGSNEPPPQSVTHEPPEADDESAPKASAGKRTARGNARTAAHLAAGRP